MMTKAFWCCLAVATLNLATANAAITDLTNWTLVEDPADPNFSASQTVSTATLSAGAGAIDEAIDIGFKSINGESVATSSSGFFFDPGESFTIAIDYQWNFTSANGSLGLGFGIGEDDDGTDSAGVAMLTSGGNPFLTFAAAARSNDVNKDPQNLGLTPSTLAGTMFTQYDASTGNVTVGASTQPGESSPEVSAFYPMIQDEWDDEGLIVSFFIRSDGFFPGERWLGGEADAVFSNFRVLEGSAVAIPEPSLSIALAFGVVLLPRRRRS